MSLGCLQSLTIYLHPNFAPRIVDNLVSQLTLPSLREFQAGYFSKVRYPYDLSVFIAFFERSSCPMNSVCIPHFILDVGDIIPAMQALPTLTELVIDTVEPIPEHILSRILVENLLPNLRKLDGCGFSSIHSAISFLNGRRSQTASRTYCGLQDFAFWLARDSYPAADQEAFQNLLPEWERDGIRVYLMIKENS